MSILSLYNHTAVANQYWITMVNPPVLWARSLMTISSPFKLWSAKGWSAYSDNDLNIPQQAIDLPTLSNVALFALQWTPAVLLNKPLNILKTLLKDIVWLEAIWTKLLSICVWDRWACVIGSVSKSDHPPEGVWLTFSTPQTPVLDPGGLSACLRENLDVVTPSTEVQAIPHRAALMPTHVRDF